MLFCGPSRLIFILSTGLVRFRPQSVGRSRSRPRVRLERILTSPPFPLNVRITLKFGKKSVKKGKPTSGSPPVSGTLIYGLGMERDDSPVRCFVVNNPSKGWSLRFSSTIFKRCVGFGYKVRGLLRLILIIVNQSFFRQVTKCRYVYTWTSKRFKQDKSLFSNVHIYRRVMIHDYETIK